jgi:hypothetical protein
MLGLVYQKQGRQDDKLVSMRGLWSPLIAHAHCCMQHGKRQAERLFWGWVAL